MKQFIEAIKHLQRLCLQQQRLRKQNEFYKQDVLCLQRNTKCPDGQDAHGQSII